MMSSSSCRSIPTEDRISNMPDSILCHILSFHPTKFAATTSVLSKRWKLVWLSVLTLDFDQGTFKDFNSFREFVYAVMFSLRDKKISIHSFTLKCGIYSHFNQKEFNRIFKFVMQRGVKNLNFDMSNKKRRIKLPHCIFNLKTLEVLKLGNINMRDFDQVDFPRLKTLHLDKVSFTSPEYFVKFLYGCPNLEDLNTKSFIYPWNPSQYDPIKNLNPLPNLVKVMILSNMDNVMTLFCKAKILHVEQRGSMACCTSTTLPMFYNLTHMELIFHHRFCESWDWSILGMLPYIPNLQHFIIQDLEYRKMFCKGYCWKHPATVPECLSTKLKICCIRTYTGTEHEFEFAKYIMQHSKVLETMKIQSTCLKKDQMLLKLYSCIRGSPTCKLFVD